MSNLAVSVWGMRSYLTFKTFVKKEVFLNFFLYKDLKGKVAVPTKVLNLTLRPL